MVNKKPQKAGRKEVGGEVAPDPSSRLKALAGDLLGVLELAIKRQDTAAMMALVGKSQNIIPALNTVTRLVQLLDEQGADGTAIEPGSVEPFEMTEGDCDLMVRYCIRRLCFLRLGHCDENAVAEAWEAWLQGTARWRKYDV